MSPLTASVHAGRAGGARLPACELFGHILSGLHSEIELWLLIVDVALDHEADRVVKVASLSGAKMGDTEFCLTLFDLL